MVAVCVGLVGAAGPSSATAMAGRTAAAACDHVDLSTQQQVVMAVKAREVSATILPSECWRQDAFDFRWEGYASNGVSQDRVAWAPFDMVPVPSIVDPIEVNDTDQLGVWRWTPDRSNRGVPLSALNSPTMDVRLGSVSYVSAARNGGRVTISTRAYRWWQSTHAFGTWGLSKGLIQSRPAGSAGPWTNLKNVSSDNYGRYSYTWTTSATLQYRVVMSAQPYVWGNTSANTATG